MPQWPRLNHLNRSVSEKDGSLFGIDDYLVVAGVVVLADQEVSWSCATFDISLLSLKI